MNEQPTKDTAPVSTPPPEPSPSLPPKSDELSPESSAQTPTSSTPQNNDTSPATTDSPITIQAPSKGRKMKWPWIIAGVIAFLAIIGGIVVFSAKQSADSVAKEYTSASAAYVTSVHDAVEKSRTIAAAKENLDKAVNEKPVLKEVFLSSLSSDYQKAKTLQGSVDSKIKEFSAGISELASINAYVTDNKEKYTEVSLAISKARLASTKTATLTAMNNVLTTLQDAEKTTSDTAFPSDLADTKQDILEAYKLEVENWQKMITALENSDSAAYEAAYTQFKLAATKESTAFKAINKYYFSIASKQRELLKKLEATGTSA